MVEKYFSDCFKTLNIPNKLTHTVKSTTKDSLSRILGKIREIFSIKDSRKSSSDSELSESPGELAIHEGDGRNYIPQISNKLLVAKLNKERAERERKRLEREHKARIRAEEEMQEIERRKQEENMLKEEEKRIRVEKLLQKKDQRKRNIEFLKELGEKEFREIITNKPLYVKIEENYEEQVLMPELEKKKAELARKREFFQPVRKQEIIDHMKRYQENSLESQARREILVKNKQIEFKYNNSACMIKSKFTENLLEEERHKRVEKEQQELEKRKLIDRKKQYASIVKENFAPSVDEFKRQEMLLIQERLKHPVRIKINDNKSISDEENKPRRKWKKNNLVPEKPPKREGKIVDYLAEKRKDRGNSVEGRSRVIDIDSLIQDDTLDKKSKIDQLKKKAQILEIEAKRHERHERNIKSVSSKDTRALIISHEADDLLLNSIRAKLAIITTNT